MIFSISQLRDFLWCEQYAHNLHTLRRGLERPSRALWLGDLFHQAMASKLRGQPILIPEQLDPEVEHDFQQMLPFLHAWQVPPTWTVHAVETALQVPVGKHILTCRPDALITSPTGTWLVQWKSLGRSFDLGVHQERVRLSWHECGYHYAASTALGQPSAGLGTVPTAINGTLLGTYKKLTKSELAAARDPFTLVPLPRTWEEVVAVVSDMEHIANRMEESLRTQQHLKNLDACFGRFGNSQCQFYEVCHGCRSLKDPPFVDLPDRYTDLSP